MKKTLYIIDASAYIHRAYHAIKPLITSYGMPVNAVYGFVKLINKVIKDKKPDYLAVCFDHPSKNFRHDISTVYKANRKQIDDDLIKQMPVAREAVNAMKLCLIEKAGYEADDMIASVAKLAEKNGINSVIVTGDKDLFQLVNENISIWNESKNIVFDREKVFEKYGIYPENIVDMLALMGDACDNVSGIKGIGEKTAVKLIQTYGSVENIIENAGSVKGRLSVSLTEGAQDAFLSKKLVQLVLDAPVDKTFDDMTVKYDILSCAGDFFKKYELYSFIKSSGGNVSAETSETENRQKKCEVAVQKEKPSYDLTNNVTIVDTDTAAEDLHCRLTGRDIIALNIETDSESLNGCIIGISFYISKDENYYIPLNHSSFITQQITQQKFAEIFRDIFCSDKIKIVGHDLKYLKYILSQAGINFTNTYFDTMLASYCIDPAKDHSVEYLSESLLGYVFENTDLAVPQNIKNFQKDMMEAADLAKYSSSKALAVFYIYRILSAELENKKLAGLFYNIEMPVLSVLYDMEKEGIKTDKDFLNMFNAQITEDISVTESAICSIAGEAFNVNSPKQLGEILFEKLKLPVIRKNKRGYSTDESVLTELSDYEIANQVLKYREMQKIKSTYIEPVIRFASGDANSRIHTVFNQAVTSTGRLSSSEPNLQNIPVRTDYGRTMRKAFIPDSGKIFISADYSQIDLRALAHISGDKTLIKAFNEGRDIHTATAMEIFGINSPEEVTKQMRMSAKAVNFGIVYGMSSFGLSQQLSIPVKEAKEYIASYMAKYSGVKEWMASVVREAKQNGFVKTITGRIRYIEEFNYSNKQLVGFGERIAMNTPVQGSSADIIKIAMINVSSKLRELNLKSKILLQVHDDLLLEVPFEEENSVIKMLQYEMENAVKLSVPLVVSMKKGINWADMEEIK